MRNHSHYDRPYSGRVLLLQYEHLISYERKNLNEVNLGRLEFCRQYHVSVSFRERSKMLRIFSFGFATQLLVRTCKWEPLVGNAGCFLSKKSSYFGFLFLHLYFFFFFFYLSHFVLSFFFLNFPLFLFRLSKHQFSFFFLSLRFLMKVLYLLVVLVCRGKKGEEERKERVITLRLFVYTHNLNNKHTKTKKATRQEERGPII